MLIRDFYSDTLGWIKSGCPKENQSNFTVHVGLCNNLLRWVEANFKHKTSIETRTRLGLFLTYKLHKEFVNDGLSEVFPFGNYHVLFPNHMKRNLYLDGVRENWIIKHLKKL